MAKIEGPARDFVGYGKNVPSGRWPNGARLAINIVLNYEEGSERSIGLGDPDQETLTEFGNYPGAGKIRDLALESMYEYGSRVGVWRVLDAMDKYDIKGTMFACAVACENNPEVTKAMAAAGHDFCSHGYRWEEVFRNSVEEEKRRIDLAVETFKRVCGKRPLGWYCRYGASIHTRRLVVEEGGFKYDSDSYNDDTPFFVDVSGKRHLVVPYSPDNNDFKFWNAPGFISADDFFIYLKDAFDTLYAEGATQTRMMSVGLHSRIIGRPGRIAGLERFFAYAKSFDGVWFTQRENIADAWLKMHG